MAAHKLFSCSVPSAWAVSAWPYIQIIESYINVQIILCTCYCYDYPNIPIKFWPLVNWLKFSPWCQIAPNVWYTHSENSPGDDLCFSALGSVLYNVHTMPETAGMDVSRQSQTAVWKGLKTAPKVASLTTATRKVDCSSQKGHMKSTTLALCSVILKAATAKSAFWKEGVRRI